MLTIQNIDATQGPIIPQILRYSYALILSTLVQTLFSAVDVAVLGNMADSTSVASVGATSTVTSLLLNAFVGFSSGTKILLARFIGARDQEKTRHTVDTAVLLSVIIGVFVAVMGWTFSPMILRLTKCPDSCFDGATLYLRVYFSAAPAVLLYNFCSSILTASGNTKSPLYYMLLGGSLNVVLNILLCLILPNKVLAVAIATAASQLLGAALTLRRLCSGKDSVRLHIKQMRWKGYAFGKIVGQGLPIFLVNVLFPVANLQIQSALNSYGVAAIAGNSASISLEGINSAIHGNLATATGVFIGQNLGAQQHDRVKRSFFSGLWISALLSLLIGNFFYATGRFWLNLILPGDTLAADFAIIRMGFILAFGFVAAINGVLSHFMQSFGYAFLSSLNSMICVLGFRVVWMNFVYPRYQTFRCLMCCYFVSWLLMLMTNIIMTSVVYARYKKGHYKRL